MASTEQVAGAHLRPGLSAGYAACARLRVMNSRLAMADKNRVPAGGPCGLAAFGGYYDYVGLNARGRADR
jgi:hypothetical protein